MGGLCHSSELKCVTMGWGREGQRLVSSFFIFWIWKEGKGWDFLILVGVGWSRTREERPLPAPCTPHLEGPHRNLPNSPVSPAPLLPTTAAPAAGWLNAQPAQQRSPADSGARHPAPLGDAAAEAAVAPGGAEDK